MKRAWSISRARSSVYLLLLIACTPSLSLHAQDVVPGIRTISPEHCVWRAGDNTEWAAAALEESSWKPYSKWKIDPSEPHIWIRCHLDSAVFGSSDHPAVQIRMLTAYEAFFDGVSIARSGNLQRGNFHMDFIRIFPVPQSILRRDADHDSNVLALRVVQRYVVPFISPDIRVGDQRSLIDDRAGYLVEQLPFSLLTDVPFIVIGIVGVVLLGFSLYDRTRIESIVLAVSCTAVGLVFLDRLCGTFMVNEPVGFSLSLEAVASAASIITQYWFPFALAKRRIPPIFWLPMGVWALYVVRQLTELFLPLHRALSLDAAGASVLTPLNFGVAALLGTAPLVAFWPWNHTPPRMRAIAGFSLAGE